MEINMGKTEWKNLDDDELDIVLEDSVGELPMEEVVKKVVPCRNVMFLVLTGMALCTIRFHFLYLDYILPVVGVILSLIGFRKLKDENMWFRFDYILTWMHTVYYIVYSILNTTIIHNNEYLITAGFVIEGLFVGAAFAELASLWLGIRAVQKKAGLIPKAYSAVFLLIWYIVLLFLAGIKYNSNFFTIVFTVVYILLLYTMSKLSKELDEAGYAIKAARIKVEDKVMTAIFAGIIIVGCACGYIFGDSYHMNWKEIKNADAESIIEAEALTWKRENMENDIAQIREKLIEQGFPDYVLNDLTDAEIAACDGAADIVVNINNNENGLQFTDVGVKMADNEKRWMIFHYYRWICDKKFYGTEAVQVWTAYRDLPDIWERYGEIAGRVLYDKEKMTYTAPYHSLEIKTYKQSHWSYGEMTLTDIFGTFSFPVKGENCRGYIVYSTVNKGEESDFNSFINYTHQDGMLQYPVITAYENRTTSWLDRKPFVTIQNRFRFEIENEK